MAKGNPILGTASKSIGDIVMYRREGTQVTRVRVRKIANPKTDAQCLQRAFMSACVKFYQPLANVLDRSWQGKSRAKSYSAFLKANAPKVRAAGYYLPKGTGFFPLPLQVSEGTIQPVSYENQAGVLVVHALNTTADTPAPTTIGALSNIFIGEGYQNGDVVTIIIGKLNDSGVYSALSAQFIIDSTSTANTIATLKIFDTVDIDGANKKLAFVSGNGTEKGVAVIVARNVDGVWQRSKQTMAVDATVLTPITSDAAKTACIESYKGAAASDNPLVYLDGDELTD